MKIIVPVILLCMLGACNPAGQNSQALQERIDSLQLRMERLQGRIDSVQKQPDKSYKPGLGEFMSGIQVHHEKLWFAGQARNWALSDFEIGEIREAVDDIQGYCADRPEVASLPMIRPALDSVGLAIKNKDLPQFKAAFILLTNTCNNCHRATKHEFNVIKIPTTPPFSNQVY